MITTVDEFFDRFDTRHAAAIAFGVVETAISMWRKRGCFPVWAMPRATQIAQTNGWALAPELVMPKKPVRKKKVVALRPGRKSKSYTKSRARSRVHAQAAE